MSPLVWMWLYAVLGVEGFKSGAPSSQCVEMMPHHGENSPQNGRTEHALTPLGQETLEGRVRLSVAGTPFKGLLVQARSTGGSGPIGSFTDFPSSLKTLSCPNATNGAVTHQDNSKKTAVEVEWAAPDYFEGDIVFLASIVSNYTTYWTGIKSTPVRVIKRSPDDSVPLASSISPIEEEMYRGCNINKLCIASPEGCLETKSCKAVVSVKPSGKWFEFELLGKEGKYVAYGISEDNKMGGDHVIECVNEDDTSVRAYRSWNLPNAKRNSRHEEQDGFSLLEGKLVEDIIYCKILQDSQVSVEGVEFSLERLPYHILLASGKELKSNRVGFHNIVFMASQDKRMLSNFGPVLVRDEFYNDCNILKSCFGYPDGCLLSQNCQAVVSVSVEGRKYVFELKGKAEGYVAVGLSDDNKMGGDSIVECAREESSGNLVKAYMSWNKPGDKFNTRQKISQDGISLLNSTYMNGHIYCKFTRNVRTVVADRTYNLVDDKYFLLLAAGSRLKAKSVGFHDLLTAASGEKRALSDVGAFTVASKLLIRLHGAFMVAAWIGTASAGIILARYFKQTWVGSSLCAKDLWFAWHRFFMILTWCLTLIGFSLIFVEIGEWVGPSSQTHALLGCVTTLLCFVQPIGAAFRPHPTARNRPLFNWLHWLVGNSAHILSIVTIFFAVPLNKAELPDWLDWVLVAFVAFYVAMHIILSFSACLSDRSNGKRVNSFPMKDMSTRTPLNSAERKQDAPHSGFRRFMLFIHLLGTIILAGAIIVIIVLAPIESQWNTFKNKVMSL